MATLCIACRVITMASENSSTIANIKNAILENGFSCDIDPLVGNRVDKIVQEGFPFKSEEGLDFCKLNTLDNMVSKILSTL